MIYFFGIIFQSGISRTEHFLGPWNLCSNCFPWKPTSLLFLRQDLSSTCMALRWSDQLWHNTGCCRHTCVYLYIWSLGLSVQFPNQWPEASLPKDLAPASLLSPECPPLASALELLLSSLAPEACWHHLLHRPPKCKGKGWLLDLRVGRRMTLALALEGKVWV